MAGTDQAATQQRLSSGRRFVALFSVCACAYVTPLWLVKYLPMVDLPQHVLQMSIWMHLGDRSLGFTGYELNWPTPYLLGYLLARPFAEMLGPLNGLKVVISASVLALPLALLTLLRTYEDPIDDAWSLLGFPLAFGFAFYWGFINFMLAVPIGLLYLALARRHAYAPSQGGAAALVLGGLLLFVSHAIAFGICIAVAFVDEWLIASERLRSVRLAPFVALLLMVFVWCASSSMDPRARVPILWQLGTERLLWLPALLLGNSSDLNAELMGLFFIMLSLVALRPRPKARWLPFVGILAVVAIAPNWLFGTAMVYQRCAIFVVPFLLLSLAPRPIAPSPTLISMVVLVGCLAWAGLLARRFTAFDVEARHFDEIEAKMLPNKRVRALIFKQRSPAVPVIPAFLHYSAYYNADKGGRSGFSFAGNFLSFVRYAGGGKNYDANEWDPRQFSLEAEPFYDYYIVRGSIDLQRVLFKGASDFRLEGHEGMWWLYHRLASRGQDE